MPEVNTEQTPFGVSGEDLSLTGRSESNSVQTQILMDSKGHNISVHTYGEQKTITEDSFLVGAFENEAVDDQSGAEVVSGHNKTESNSDFTRVNKTILSVPGNQPA